MAAEVGKVETVAAKEVEAVEAGETEVAVEAMAVRVGARAAVEELVDSGVEEAKGVVAEMGMVVAAEVMAMGLDMLLCSLGSSQRKNRSCCHTSIHYLLTH
jgi:hypothetical protein